jgi:hypothetical protein
MSSEIATLSEPEFSDAQAWDAAGEGCALSPAERRLERLDRLAEAGLQMVAAIERRVKDAPPDQPLAELNAAAMAYSRVSRAVRLAILLQDQLSGAAADPAEAARKAEAERKKAHVMRAARIVERVAREHCGVKPSKAADYEYMARERLDDDDLYGLVLNHPVGELVAMICREFGLEPDWDVLAEEAWALREIESGAEGSPFLERGDDDDDEEVDDEEVEDDEAPLPHAGGETIAEGDRSNARRVGGGECAGSEDPEPGRVAQVIRPKTFNDRLQALARDPKIIATACGDTS